MNLLRIIYLQIFWYLFVKFADQSWAIFFPVLAVGLTLIDKHVFMKQISWSSYRTFTFFLFIIGITIDSIIINLGLVYFPWWNHNVSPPFLWAIWIIFFPYYSLAFEKFEGRYKLAALCALLLAPLSYYSGSKIGSMIFTTPYSYLAIAILWGFFFPISIKLYQKLKNQ